MQVKIKNKTNTDFLVVFSKSKNQYVIKQGKESLVFLDECKFDFVVQKHYEELNIFEKIISFILGSIIAALLHIFNYFTIETLEDSIEFPVNFIFENCANDDIIIELNENENKMFLCSAKVNTREISGDLIISKEKYIQERKMYYKSLYLTFSIPFVAITLIATMILLNFQTLWISLITIFCYICLNIPLVVIMCKNRSFSKKFLNSLETNQTRNTGDGSLC